MRERRQTPSERTCRAPHHSADSFLAQICSAVQFRPHHPWEVMTGGLDSHLLRWDYGSGRVRHSWNMAEAEAGDGGAQVYTPLCRTPY